MFKSTLLLNIGITAAAFVGLLLVDLMFGWISDNPWWPIVYTLPLMYLGFVWYKNRVDNS